MERFLLSDLDETKISIKDFYLETLVRTAHSFGFTGITLDDVEVHYKQFVDSLGLDFETFWTRFAEFDPRETLEGSIQLAEEGKIRKFPDTDYFNEEMNRLSFKIGILSDNPHGEREMIALGLEKTYACYRIWEREMGHEFLKPDTRLAVSLLKEMGYNGELLWVMGDTEKDIELGSVLSRTLNVPVRTIQHHTVCPRSVNADIVVPNLTEAYKSIREFYSK